jgi:hypothetical protein
MLGISNKIANGPSRLKLTSLAIGLVLAVGLIALGLLGGGAERAPERSPPNLAPRAQLGQAPASEIFNQTYQGRLEQMVREQMQSFRAELDSRDRAREARDAAQMERITRMVNDSSLRASVPEPKPSPAAAIPPEAPKYVLLHEGSSRPGEPWTAGLDRVGTTPSAAAGPLSGAELADTGAGQRDADPFVVPQDGWAEGRLINGVVTAHGGEFRYAQIKLQGMYHSANDYEQDVDGCVVLGESTADLAAGRINIKPIKLTCTLPTARTKTWQTAGYIVDSRDGIQGIAATVVNNGESKLAAATGAGLIQGGGAFYAQRSITSTFSPVTGSAASILTGNPVNALVGGAVEGAGRSLGQEVQNYYAAFHPTVQTGGGVKVVVFLTTPLPLPQGGESISTVRGAK